MPTHTTRDASVGCTPKPTETWDYRDADGWRAQRRCPLSEARREGRRQCQQVATQESLAELEAIEGVQVSVQLKNFLLKKDPRAVSTPSEGNYNSYVL